MFKKNYNLKYFWPQTSPVASNRGGLGGKATTMFNTVATSLPVDQILLEAWYHIVDSLPTDMCYAVMVYPWLQRYLCMCQFTLVCNMVW